MGSIAIEEQRVPWPVVPAISLAPNPRPVTALLLGALVVGSAVAVDPAGLAPFGPLRWTVVTVLLAAAGVTAARRGSWRIERRTALAGAVLLGALLVATVAAIDPLHAWLGTPDRRLGFLAWIGFALAFACGQAVAFDGRVVARAGVVASGAIGCYALVEWLGRAPVDVEFAAGRLGGPYGQPAYLGAAGCLLVPLAIGLACDRGESRQWRAVATAGAALGAFALVSAQARAAWVGLAVATLLVARPAIAFARTRPRIAMGVVAVAVLLAVLTTLGARAASILDPTSGTARGRVDEWQVAAEVAADHPIVGVGPEGYRIAFTGAVDAEYEQRYGRDVATDRAHNGVLDVWVTAGIVAALAYLALAVLLVATAWRARRGPPWVVGIAVAVVAYLVQQQFLFPLAEIDPVFWVFAGVLVGRDLGRRRIALARAWALPIAALGITVLISGALDVAADRALYRATRDNDLAAADRATELRPDSIRTWFVAARVAESAGTILAVDAALDRIEAGLDRSPRDPILRAERASLLLEYARRSQRPADVDAAVEALEALVADDPTHTGYRRELAVAYAMARRG
jgi:O-antigen ligase